MPLNLVEEIAARAAEQKAAAEQQAASKGTKNIPQQKAPESPKAAPKRSAAASSEGKVTLPKNRYTIYLSDETRQKLDDERAKARKPLSTIIEEALTAFFASKKC